MEILWLAKRLNVMFNRKDVLPKWVWDRYQEELDLILRDFDKLKHNKR